MKQVILALFFLAVAGTETNAKPIAVLENSLSGNRTLTADSCYVLRGVYVVNDNAVLTINPGVEIRCEEGSSLVVMQGGQLFSNGTSSQPVVFSPYQDPGLRTPGFWTGILVNGKAENNVVNGGGGTYPIDRGGITYLGGGSINNDNSGSITFTHILYAGRSSVGNEETHGLTLNGVGSGTTINNVQVAYSATDGIALLGGQVNISDAYVLNAYRNDLFVKLGYTGTISGVLTMRNDLAAHHTDGSNGMLVWNNGDNPAYTPLTQPEVLNCSFIGPKFCNPGTVHADFENGILFDFNGGGDFHDNVIIGYNNAGLFINDPGSSSRTNLPTPTLAVNYCSFTNNVADYGYNTFAINPWNGCGLTMLDWITGSAAFCGQVGNQFNPFDPKYDPSFCGAYCALNFQPNFVLDPTSELDEPSSSSLFDFRGGIQMGDLFGWVEVCPQDYAYCIPDLLKNTSSDSKLQIVPNPAQNQAYLLFDAAVEGNAKVVIFDKVTGRSLYQKNIRIDQVGEQRVPVSVQGLMEGVYTIRVEMKDRVLHGKVSVK